MLLACCLLLASTARSEFTTVINLPPDTLERFGTIESNTQVNVLPGGVLPDYYNIGSIGHRPRILPLGSLLLGDYGIGQPSTSISNIEINLLGGEAAGDLWTSGQGVEATDVYANLIDGLVRGSVHAPRNALVTLTGAQVQGGLGVGGGSSAIVSGGTIGRDLSASGGSSVQMTDGRVGPDSWYYYGGGYARDGSTFQMSGGAINGNLRASDGSLATVSGGTISGELEATDGSSVQITGGTVGREGSYFSLSGGRASGGSTFLMSGGVLHGALSVGDSYASLSGGRVNGELVASSNSTLDWSGGSAGPLKLYSDSHATLQGNDFRIDGVPIEGLAAYSQEVTVPSESVLTGVLSDGTPIALTDTSFLQDEFENGRLSLSLTPIPAAEPRAFSAPSDALPNGLRTGQSLAVGPGGVVPANFTALAGTSVTINGGEVRHGFEAVGSTVKLSDGVLGEQAILLSGATLHATGGEVGSNFEVGRDSRFVVDGTTVGGVFVAHPGSDVRYSGGHFQGSLQASNGSQFTIAGGEFKINGVPVEPPAGGRSIDLPQHAVLSGTLTDGTPFALGRRFQWFAPGSLFLESAELPDAGPSLLRVPEDDAPSGLRSGQTLILSDGGALPGFFVADAGSIVRMSGGHIGRNFQAVGSLVDVNGGTVESVEALFGSLVNLRDGETGRASVGRGGIVNLSGGVVNRLDAWSGGRATVSGGTVRWGSGVLSGSSLRVTGGNIESDVRVSEGSSLTVEGGTLHEEISAYGAQLTFRGGRFGDGLLVVSGSEATIAGSSIRLDGVPLSTGEYGFGATIELDLEDTQVLSGVFSDGTPFAFSPSDGDHFEAGSLTVLNGRPPLFLPLTRRLPVFGETPLPDGLKPERQLTLSDGDDVGDHFNAAWDSELTIAGGSVGNNFEAVGAVVNLSEGTIGERADIFIGAELNITGGEIGDELTIHSGGTVNLAGGTLREAIVRDGAVLKIEGGLLDERPDDDYVGGEIVLEPGAELHITGTDFLLNHEPIEGLLPGTSIVLDLDDDQPFYKRHLNLTATLLDGSPFAAQLEGYPSNIPNNWIFDGDVTVRLTHALSAPTVPEPAGLMIAMAILLMATVPRRAS